jgi:hypothetical protein
MFCMLELLAKRMLLEKWKHGTKTA